MRRRSGSLHSHSSHAQAPNPRLSMTFSRPSAQSKPACVHPLWIRHRVGAAGCEAVLQDGWAVASDGRGEAHLLRSAPLEQFALKYIDEHKK